MIWIQETREIRHLVQPYPFNGKGEEAYTITALMKNGGVKIIAGYTVIEIENKLYTFTAREIR